MKKHLRKNVSRIKGTKWTNTNFTKASYKSEDAYLDAFYKKNAANMMGVTKNQFKTRVKMYKKSGLNIEGALRKYGSTMTFMTQDEIAKHVAEAYMDKQIEKELIKHGGGITEYGITKSGKKKKKTTIDWDSFTYDNKTQSWLHSSGAFGFSFEYGKNSDEEDWINVFTV